MRAFFGCGRDDVTGCIDRWLTARAAGDEKLRRSVAADPARRRAFLRYYALRASSAYSSGAHDEWNIFVRINRRRPLGEQVAVFFDGRPASPPEMETEVSPGPRGGSGSHRRRKAALHRLSARYASRSRPAGRLRRTESPTPTARYTSGRLERAPPCRR
jgi:hypothetical protein